MLLRWLITVAVFIYSPDYVFLQGIFGYEDSKKVISCEIGWYQFTAHCYRIIGAERKLNWKGSADRCVDLGGYLVTIESKEENDFLVALLLLETKKSVWIGLHDQGNESNYQWQSGSQSKYRNWRPLDPSGTSRENKDCIELLVDLSSESVGEWNAQDCDQSIGYVCKKRYNPYRYSPNLIYCSSDEGEGFKFLNSCYHIVPVKKTWEEAEQHCIDNYDGHLITILDKAVDFYLQYLLQGNHAEMWIGIKVQDRFQQKWTSGWYVGYNGFNETINDFIYGTCAVRNQRNMWSIVPCSEKYSFICEKSKVKAPVLKPPVTGTYCPSIPEDWRDLDGELCYFVETQNTASWYEANFQCKKRGGNLVSLHSKDESDILQPFIQYIASTAAFIGLLRQYGRENDTFGWTDGSSFDFVNWNSLEAKNEYEECVEVQSSDMKWNDIGCNEKRVYICSIRKIIPIITTTTTEMPDSGGCSDGTVNVKVLIGVCVILVVILLGVVI